MSFDLSRDSFRPTRDFALVVQQQGRVQLDADLNENGAITDRRLRAAAIDLATRAFHPAAMPDAFRISSSGGALSVHPGRYYVDGLVAENRGIGGPVWDDSLDEERGTDPLPLADQPWPLPSETDPRRRPHLAYLDVWRRPVTYVEDPALVETAVGVDSAARLQTVWRVRLLPLDVDDTSCVAAEDSAAWQALTAPPAARLTNGSSDALPDPNPCRPPPATGYRGLENQLYRVEIHDGGDQQSATWKWSRENGSVLTAVRAIDPAGTRLTVDSLGRDDRLSFRDGDWVELTDEARELNGLPGFLTRIAPANGIDVATRSITLAEPVPAGMFPTDAADRLDPARATRLRRWDQAGPVLNADGSTFADLDASGFAGGIPMPPAGAAVALENGLTVAFDLDGAGAYRSGDYWLFAARAAEASFERLTKAPPRGIHHHYARLAIIGPNGVQEDCRTAWPQHGDGDCACTIVVRTTDELVALPKLLPADRLVHVCLAAGVYELRETVTLNGARVDQRASRGALRVTGAGAATRIETGDECALELEQWARVQVSDLFVRSGVDFTRREKGVGIMGAITVRDTLDVMLHHLIVDCAGGKDQEAVCLRVFGGPNEGRPPLLRGVTVRDCLLMVGEQATGVLVTDARQTDISGVEVRPSMLAPEQQEPIVRRGRARVTGRTEGRPGHTGIRIAGSFAREVRITGNSIWGTLRGIHVALSHDAPRESRDIADRITITDNRLDLSAPLRAEAPDAYGVFVGNCDSLRIGGNAIAFAAGSFPQGRMRNGIHVAGALGRFAIIRQNHLTSCAVGIRFEPQGQEKTKPLWVIGENMAEDTKQVVVDASNLAKLDDNRS
jgi:hypothetical protein